MNLIQEYLHVNYQNKISLSELCCLSGVNRTSLNRNFKAQTGRTVMDYLLWHRIKIACEALGHTNLTMAEISEATGFQYETYFNRQFTAKMGMTPGEYRKGLREKHGQSDPPQAESPARRISV